MPPTGYIDLTGAWVLEPELIEGSPFSGEVAFVRRKRGGALIRRDGSPAFAKAVQHADIGDGVFRFVVGAKLSQRGAEIHGGSWGFLRDDGTLLFEPLLAHASSMHDRRAFVHGEIKVKRKRRMFRGVVSADGEVLFETDASSVGAYAQGRAPACRLSSYGILDEEGSLGGRAARGVASHELVRRDRPGLRRARG